MKNLILFVIALSLVGLTGCATINEATRPDINYQETNLLYSKLLTSTPVFHGDKAVFSVCMQNNVWVGVDALDSYSENIFISDKDGKNQKRITDVSRRVHDQYPQWTKDGDIVFHRIKSFLGSGREDLGYFLVDMEGDEVKEIKEISDYLYQSLVATK